ncbi:hypothetical protein HPP92_003685 [Vanilla planifolia]|uniref:Uncharacterized protein n=1 Tax=Vanilla planifolia TaxID=51239 RepID=A0A835RVK6_VANPL|nr:hypothetical protein HPP92_003685 [Vanilla planifolia]
MSGVGLARWRGSARSWSLGSVVGGGRWRSWVALVRGVGPVGSDGVGRGGSALAGRTFAGQGTLAGGGSARHAQESVGRRWPAHGFRRVGAAGGSALVTPRFRRGIPLKRKSFVPLLLGSSHLAWGGGKDVNF